MSVIRNGPIPLFVHGVVEYLAGAVFILAPFVIGFDDNVPTAVSIVVGVVLLLVAITTEYPAGVVPSLPLSVHIVMDYVLGVFLVAAPFIFAFTEDSTAFLFFVVLGVVHLVVTTMTGFPAAPEEEEAEEEQP